MSDLLIVLIVFSGITAIVAIICWSGYKEEELNARIRLRELEAGVAPGTYSKISKKDMKRARRMAKDHPQWADGEKEAFRRHGEAEEREEILRGIADLKARLENIDTIMSRRRTEGRKND